MEETAIEFSQNINVLLYNLVDLYRKVIQISKELENFNGCTKIQIYEQSYCSGDDKQVRTRLATFHEQMQIIEIYLKRIASGPDGGDKLTKEEKELFESANIMDGLVWYYMPKYMKSLIQWLEEILKIKYQPGKQVF